MKEKQIRLSSFQDVRELATLASSVDYRVMISEAGKTVNAKSMMCMFSLDLRHPVTLLLDCDDDDFEAFSLKTARFEIV